MRPLLLWQVADLLRQLCRAKVAWSVGWFEPLLDGEPA
jgi:hypothetical protein